MRLRRLLVGVRRALRGEDAPFGHLVFLADPPSIGGKANIHHRARVMLHGRMGAEQAVGRALTKAENDAPTESQVDELAEAVDALSDRTYRDAVEIAEKSTQKLRESTHNYGDRLRSLRLKFIKLLKRPFPKEK